MLIVDSLCWAFSSFCIQRSLQGTWFYSKMKEDFFLLYKKEMFFIVGLNIDMMWRWMSVGWEEHLSIVWLRVWATKSSANGMGKSRFSQILPIQFSLCTAKHHKTLPEYYDVKIKNHTRKHKTVLSYQQSFQSMKDFTKWEDANVMEIVNYRLRVSCLHLTEVHENCKRHSLKYS